MQLLERGSRVEVIGGSRIEVLKGKERVNGLKIEGISGLVDRKDVRKMSLPEIQQIESLENSVFDTFFDPIFATSAPQAVAKSARNGEKPGKAGFDIFDNIFPWGGGE
jgi:hypothetical protein